jgi:DNA-binding NarL/FixJ family response regulator
MELGNFNVGQTESVAVGSMRKPRPISVLLVDADLQFAHAVARDFVRNGLVVKLASTLESARRHLREDPTQIDVVVLDLCLPDGRGESLLSELDVRPRQPAVIMTSTFSPEYQASAFEYRPATILKPVSTAALQRLVQAVAKGYAWPAVKRFTRLFRLTKREEEVTTFLAHGLKPKEIADRLHCHEKAVYAVLSRLCTKTYCLDYHQVLGKLFEFACQALGRTPPEYPAFVDDQQDSLRDHR